jgi:hypothetical protein
MNKVSFIKFLEYIPFAGVIPGGLRLIRLYGKRHSRITEIATECLGPSKTHASELTRGIVGMIPLLNLTLIPFDIVNAILVKKPKNLTEKERLTTIRDNLVIIKKQYELLNGCKSENDIADWLHQNHFEIHNAWVNLSDNLEITYKKKNGIPLERSLYEYLGYPRPSPSETEAFSEDQFMRCTLYAANRIASSAKKPVRIRYFMERTLDSIVRKAAADFLYKHHEEMLKQVTEKLDSICSI